MVLFRGATVGVGTHGLPTRSRVSDLTRRVIDAAISLAAEEVFIPPLHLALSRRADFIMPDNATSSGLSHVFRGYGKTSIFEEGGREREKETNASPHLAISRSMAGQTET